VAIAVSATETLKAIAVKTGFANSAVASATFTIEKPAATPVFSPVAGTYSSAQSVKITDTTAGATIYYTVNGTTPTTSSTKYTAAITVSATETIKAIAVATGLTESAVASATFAIEKPAATPVFSPAAGTYSTIQTVKITDTTAGATIYYTVNGTTPTTSSTKYTAAITVSATETIEAIAVATGLADSAVASATFTITSGGGGGGGAGKFWLPFTATPAPKTTGGESGLFLIASNDIASSTPPTPTFITKNGPTILGFAFDGFVSGTAPPTSETPATLIYSGLGTDGNIHIYGLDLTDTSTVPVPTQLTNLSLVPSSKHVCSGGQVQSDLTTPSSLSVVIYVTAGDSGAQPGTFGYCGVSPGTYELVNYTDDSTASPTVLDIPGGTSSYSALQNDGPFTALYQDSGKLGGIVLWDAATTDVNFYADETFTSATKLLTSAGNPLPCVAESTVANGLDAGNFGRMLTNVSNSSVNSAYVITASGAAPTEFFAGLATDCALDETNLYFIGIPATSAKPGIYQEPAAGTPPAQLIFSGLPTAAETGSSLIGSNDSVLVFQNYSISTSGIESSTVLTIPEGKLSSSATTIGGPYTGYIDPIMASPTTNPDDDLLFLTVVDETYFGDLLKVTYSDRVLTTGGSMKQTTADSAFESFGANAGELDGNLLEVKGATDTDGGYGGATVDLFDVSTLVPTPLTVSSGTSYVVPAGYVIEMIGFYGTDIAQGLLLPVSGGTATPTIGAAVDVSKHAILPISIKNTNVSIF
jgi:hypothetical protein